MGSQEGGGDALPGSPETYSGAVSTVTFSGSGIADAAVHHNGNSDISVMKNATGPSGGTGAGAGPTSIYDEAASVCLFSNGSDGDNTTSSGIQIITGAAPSNTSCTKKNKCILCTLGSATPVQNCTISCVGIIPSMVATAADTVPIFVTFSSILKTNAPAAEGMVRYDAYSTDWTEFSMSNNPVAFVATGCDGGVDPLFEAGLNIATLVFDNPYWTATHQVNGYAISLLNPNSGSSPANQSSCTTSFEYAASMPLTGADTPNSTISFSSKTVSFKATMCDVTDPYASDPAASTNCPAE